MAQTNDPDELFRIYLRRRFHTSLRNILQHDLQISKQEVLDLIRQTVETEVRNFIPRFNQDSIRAVVREEIVRRTTTDRAALRNQSAYEQFNSLFRTIMLDEVQKLVRNNLNVKINYPPEPPPVVDRTRSVQLDEGGQDAAPR